MLWCTLHLCYLDSAFWGEVPVSTRHDTGVGVRFVSDTAIFSWTRLSWSRSTQFPFFSFPVHLLYISDTQGRTRWEGSSPSLWPADHLAGISHSRWHLDLWCCPKTQKYEAWGLRSWRWRWNEYQPWKASNVRRGEDEDVKIRMKRRWRIFCMLLWNHRDVAIWFTGAMKMKMTWKLNDKMKMEMRMK